MSTPKPFAHSFCRRRSTRTVLLTVIAFCVVATTGCMGVATLMHVAGMDLVPAEYDGLEKSSVAIVTITDSSLYTNDVAARELTARVGAVLSQNVKGVELVREDLVEQWRDTNGRDSLDFPAIGKGVSADKVLVIEVANLRLRDGQTLFQGQSDVSIKVVDIKSGNIVYNKMLDEYTFPKSTGQHTSETTESRFRKLYLSMLASEIGRSFHPYDINDRIALDSMIASQ